jgi:1-hydroxycarotenoid 3,4-desaturase
MPKGQQDMRGARVVVIGAGIGGLSCASTLAAHGAQVTVLEAGRTPGGRMRETFPGGQPVDSGPTVLTLASVFHELFAQTGEQLADHLTLEPLAVLARHSWGPAQCLDLHADHAASRAAIAAFAGPREAAGFDRFSRDARTLYQGLETRFMRVQKPGLLEFAARLGPLRAFQLRAGQPFASLWSAVGHYFEDPRLRQLFGRYATYVGSSPFAAPAVLMLIAEVEMNGVYTVRGGMAQLARALAALGERRGVRFEYGQRVEQVHCTQGRVSAVECADGSRIAADAVVYNGELGALADGRLGSAVSTASGGPARPPSLSALTFAWHARAEGFPLAHHTVFFSADYAREFDELFGKHRLPSEPTVYLCAQDRATEPALPRPAPGRVSMPALSGAPAAPGRSASPVVAGEPGGPERLFAIINAPALGAGAAVGSAAAQRMPEETELARARGAGLALLEHCGLHLDILDEQRTGPADFARLFPGNGGAIYGQSCHGWRAPFDRPGARTPVRGFYLAGGGVHPGPGVPMVAISGQLAAAAIMADREG